MDIPRHEADVDAVAHMLNDVDAGRYGQVVTPVPEQDVLAALDSDAGRNYARILAHAAQERRRDPHSARAQQLMQQARQANAARPAHGDNPNTITHAAVALAVGYAAASVRRQQHNDTATEQARADRSAADRGTETPRPGSEKASDSERATGIHKDRSSASSDFRRGVRSAAAAVGPIAADGEVEPPLSPVDPVEVAASVSEMSKTVAGVSSDVLAALTAAAKCAGRGTASQRRKASAATRSDDSREHERAHDYDYGTEREHNGLTL